MNRTWRFGSREPLPGPRVRRRHGSPIRVSGRTNRSPPLVRSLGAPMPWPRCAVRVFAAFCSALPATVSAQAADTVRGVVYDSLLMAPIEGATVIGSSAGQDASSQVTTDRLGRFVLVSVLPLQRIAAYHESLEVLGVSALSAARPTATGPWQVALSTPSAETIWTRLCSGHRPRDGRGGIVFGTVRRAVDSLPVAAAQLELQWEDIRAMRRPSDTAAVYAAVTTRSNAEGIFAFCGVQEFGQSGIVASAGSSRSAGVLIPADLRPVRRIDLTVGEPQSRGSVRGTVVDEDGRPVADANVLVDGLSEGGTTGKDGRFQLVDVPLGSRMMVARKVGHVPVYRPLNVSPASAGDLVLRLERGVTLEGVKVRARANVSRDRREFDERRLAGQAQLMDSTQLRNFTSLQTALRSYPSLNVVTANNGTEFRKL